MIDAIAGRAREERAIPGLSVVVMRGGAVLHAKGYGLADLESGAPATPETVYPLGSIAKQFTAAGVLRLAEQGALALEDPVTRYVPELKATRALRVHHLLRQASGVREFNTLPAFQEGIEDLDRPAAEHLAMIVKEPLGFEPGERWAYSNSNYILLATILERVTGTPYEGVLDVQFFRPLGLASFHHCAARPSAPHHARGYARRGGRIVPGPLENMSWARGDGGLCGSALDLARWAHALGTGRALRPESYRAMVATKRLRDGTRPPYGFGLSLVPLDGARERVAHNGAIGGFQGTVARYPADDLVVVVLTNRADSSPEVVEKAIARALLGLPPPAHHDRPTTAAERARHVGVYEIGVPGLDVAIEERDGRLWLVMPRPAPSAPLRHHGEGTFVSTTDPDAVQVTFAPAGERSTHARVLFAGMHWYGRRLR